MGAVGVERPRGVVSKHCQRIAQQHRGEGAQGIRDIFDGGADRGRARVMACVSNCIVLRCRRGRRPETLLAQFGILASNSPPRANEQTNNTDRVRHFVRLFVCSHCTRPANR